MFIRQIAALPWRIDEGGEARILLITSRSSGRWVIPKGNLMRGLADHAAAAREAYEEAGVRGFANPQAIGDYPYLKQRRDGTTRAMTVAVYPLAVTRQLAAWPEQHERTIGWFARDDAARSVEEPGLRALIAGFRAPVADAAAGETDIALPDDPLPLSRWLRRRLTRE